MKSNTSQCSAESEDLNLGSNEPTVYHELRRGGFRQSMKGICPTLVSRMATGGNNIPCINVSDIQKSKNHKTKEVSPIYLKDGSRNPEAHRIYSPMGISPAMKTPALIVSGTLKLTNIQSKPTSITSPNTKTTETQQKSTQMNYQTLICSVEDFLANHSQSLESGKDLMTLEVQCFLRLREYLKLKDLKLYSLKTSKGYSITTKGRLLESSFKRWGNWGIELNGWYLTASFLEYPRTEKGCSLSEVLETKPDQKYYLSEKATKSLKENMKIRRLTPTECLRLQGFPDDWFPYDLSNTQRYKQMGNAVTVNVIQAITEKLLHLYYTPTTV